MSYRDLLKREVNKTLSVSNPYIKNLQDDGSHYVLGLANVSAESYWGNDEYGLSQTLKGFLNTELKDNTVVAAFAPYQAEFLVGSISIVNEVTVNDLLTVNGKTYQIVGIANTVRALTKLFLREL